MLNIFNFFPSKIGKKIDFCLYLVNNIINYKINLDNLKMIICLIGMKDYKNCEW